MAHEETSILQNTWEFCNSYVPAEDFKKNPENTDVSGVIGTNLGRKRQMQRDH